MGYAHHKCLGGHSPPYKEKLSRRQIYCPHCQKYSTEMLNFVSRRRTFTKRYEEYIYERVKELTIEQVSINEGLTAEQVQTIFTRIAKNKKKSWLNPTRISLDEFSRKKGKRKFVTVVSDIDKSSLLEVIDSHKSHEIIEVLKAQPESIRAKVTEVSVDMCPVFPKVIQDVFPNALIVIDRFHVMQLVNKKFNKLRLLFNLKGNENRYLLLKNQEKLTEDDQIKSEQILSEYPPNELRKK